MSVGIGKSYPRNRYNEGSGLVQERKTGYPGPISIAYNIYSIVTSAIYHIFTIDGIFFFFMPSLISIFSNLQKTVQANGSKRTRLKTALDVFTGALMFIVVFFFGILLRQSVALNIYLPTIIGIYAVFGFIAVCSLGVTLMDRYRVDPKGVDRETADTIRSTCYVMYVSLMFLAYVGVLFGGPVIGDAFIYSNLIFLSAVFQYCSQCMERTYKKTEGPSFLQRNRSAISGLSGIVGFYLMNTYLKGNTSVMQKLLEK